MIPDCRNASPSPARIAFSAVRLAVVARTAFCSAFHPGLSWPERLLENVGEAGKTRQKQAR
ncbi:hypothetical protein, partial [Stutzerimonas nitrititolerans]|uniref:hypothetical protein n=1 Tax=Stutzerimonas nitrititolerans TaxID=2482751 RepID=UPI0028A1FE87